MRTGRLLTILLFVILATQLRAQKPEYCQDKLQIVEKAFSAFVSDSIRKVYYFLNATEAAENILKNCPVDDGQRRAVIAKKNILDLYSWLLKSFSDYYEFKDVKQVLRIKFFESKVDSLKYIHDVLLQPYINYLRGIYYLRVARNYPLAITYFQKTLSERNDCYVALNELASAYIFVGKPDSARLFADNCIKVNPNYARGYITLGYSYGYAKNINQAVEYFRKALYIDANLPGAYLALGKWSLLTDNDSADYYYEKAIDTDPESIAANYSFALRKFEKSNYGLAEKYFRRCVNINPKLPDAYVGIGLLDSINMKKHYDAAVSLDSSYLYVLGWNDKQKGNFDGAIEWYEKALPYINDKWTNFDLGLCYYEKSDYAKSIQYLKRSTELDSTWADPHAWLGYIYNIQLNTEKAIEHLGKAFQLHFDWATERYFPLLASDKLRKKDTAVAFKVLKDGHKEGCQSCLSLRNALMFEYGFDNVDKDYEESMEWYQVALKKDSLNFGEIARDAIVRLYTTDKISLGSPVELQQYRDYYRRFADKKIIYADKLVVYEKLIMLDEVLLKSSIDKDLLINIAGDYNDLGWFALLTKDFPKAKTAIEKGLKLDSSSVYLIGNEAHVLLFNGQEEKAKKKYTQLKDQIFIKGSALPTFKDSFRADFEDFKKENFSAADLEKIESIKKLLNIK